MGFPVLAISMDLQRRSLVTQVHIVDHPLHAKALLRRQSFVVWKCMLCLCSVMDVQYVVSVCLNNCLLASVNEWFYVLYGMHIMEVWFGAPFRLFATRNPGKSLYCWLVRLLIFCLTPFFTLLLVFWAKNSLCVRVRNRNQCLYYRNMT